MSLISVLSFHPGGTECHESCDDIHHSACVNILSTKPDMCSDAVMAEKYCRKTCGKCGTYNYKRRH